MANPKGRKRDGFVEVDFKPIDLETCPGGAGLNWLERLGISEPAGICSNAVLWKNGRPSLQSRVRGYEVDNSLWVADPYRRGAIIGNDLDLQLKAATMLWGVAQRYECYQIITTPGLCSDAPTMEGPLPWQRRLTVDELSSAAVRVRRLRMLSADIFCIDKSKRDLMRSVAEPLVKKGSLLLETPTVRARVTMPRRSHGRVQLHLRASFYEISMREA